MFSHLIGNASQSGQRLAGLGDAPIGSTIGSTDAALAAAQAAIFRARDYPNLIANNAALSSALNSLLAQFGTGTAQGWGAGSGQQQYIDEIRQRTAQVLSYLPGGANYVEYTPPPPPVYVPPPVVAAPPLPEPGPAQPGPPIEITPPIAPAPVPPIIQAGTVSYTPPSGDNISMTVRPLPPAPEATQQIPAADTGTISLPVVGAISHKTVLLIGAGIAAYFLLGKGKL